MADLSVNIDGLHLPNPFVVASGPPGTNARVIGRAFDEGWGGVVCKTLVLDASRILNVAPRYARMRAGEGRGRIIGWENIELITDRPFETWLDEIADLKARYPDRALIVSIMEECSRDAWHEIVERTQEAGADALELNLSCPHGLPERRMGSAMGQDPELTEQVCRWVHEVARVPVYAKLTPNVTDITAPARAAFDGGCAGVTAINTILSVMGIDLDTLRPEPTVEGYSTPGGYSGPAVRPIALRMVMESARAISQGYDGARTLHAAGGVESGEDAAQHLLVGASTVQVCTGVMIHGYGLVHELCRGLEAFMDRHGFKTIGDFRGASLPYFTTHAELVRRQREAKQTRRAELAGRRVGNGEAGGTAPPEQGDDAWTDDRFVEQSDALAGSFTRDA